MCTSGQEIFLGFDSLLKYKHRWQRLSVDDKLVKWTPSSSLLLDHTKSVALVYCTHLLSLKA